MRKNIFVKLCAAVISCLMITSLIPAQNVWAAAGEKEKIVLRVCNWEEYIDLGDWDEEETIDLESGDIIGTRRRRSTSKAATSSVKTPWSRILKTGITRPTAGKSSWSILPSARTRISTI